MQFKLPQLHIYVYVEKINGRKIYTWCGWKFIFFADMSFDWIFAYIQGILSKIILSIKIIIIIIMIIIIIIINIFSIQAEKSFSGQRF